MTDLIQKAGSSLIDWGPGMLIAAMMLFGLYRLILRVGMKMISSLDKPTSALMMQANSMDKLTSSIKDYVGRDQSEHREIIMLQKVILDRIEGIKNGQKA